MISGTTPEGLRYAVRQSGRSVAYCALTIGAGTRDEAPYPAGIAHFVEHTLFRGTRRKSASVISGYLDKLGGELNAYTTKEEIVLHATVLKEDIKRAAGLLFELATEPTFPDREVETERGVVLDEIISYKDNPAEGKPAANPHPGHHRLGKENHPGDAQKLCGPKVRPGKNGLYSGGRFAGIPNGENGTQTYGTCLFTKS